MAHRSPDLSSLEPVWDQLKRKVPSCHSVHDLELAVQDLWAYLPQDNARGYGLSLMTIERFCSTDKTKQLSNKISIFPLNSVNLSKVWQIISASVVKMELVGLIS
ncbi:hypothetical protein TNCV_4109021 [Trichonephila clavipes]|nr:hypothetical protein TNCV_4109021 [Trichonephila clavipes]